MLIIYLSREYNMDEIALLGKENYSAGWGFQQIGKFMELLRRMPMGYSYPHHMFTWRST